MYKRAFLAVQYQTDDLTVQGWGVVDVPWPPTRVDLQERADELARCIGAPESARIIITSMTWVSDVREE